jgi:hypothetical protein
VLTGDANMNGVVDADDIQSILAYHFNDNQHAIYTQGDLANHGLANADDIQFVLSANYGSQESLSVVSPTITADAPVVIALPIAAGAGVAYQSTVATFSPAVAGSAASDYLVTVNWGDGTIDSTDAANTTQPVGVAPNGNGSFSVFGSHMYALPGSSLNATVSVTHLPSGLAGNGSSPVSITAPVDTTPPAAPSNAHVGTVSPDGITISWQSNSSNEDGFNIEWSDNGSDFYIIDTVGPGTTTYTDADPIYNQFNYYRVSAYRGEADSDPTNVVSGRPITAPENFDNSNAGYNGRNTLSPYAVIHDQTLVVSAENGLLANDMDLAGQSISIADNTQPSHGSLDLNGDGSFIYTPQPGWTGTDTFNYRATDGTNVSTSTDVAIDVTNAVPLAPDMNFSSAFPSPSGRLPASDGDGDPLTYSITTEPQHGTVTLDENTGQFTYNVASDFMGNDSFKYVASDGLATSDAGEVTIGSFVHHDAIAASDYEVYVKTGESGGLTLLPRITAATPWVIVAGPQHGACTLQLTSAGQVLTYTPNADFAGDDSVQLSHSLYGTDEWSKPFTVGLYVADEAPEAYWPGDANFLLGVSNVLPSSFDQTAMNLVPPDSGVSVALTQDALHGTVTVSSTGALTYVPKSEPSGKRYFGWDICKVMVTQPWGQKLDQWIEFNVGNYTPPVPRSADQIDPADIPGAMMDVWNKYLDAKAKLGTVLHRVADLGQAAGAVSNLGIDYETAEGSAISALDAVTQAFDEYSSAYRTATSACGNYMKDVWFTTQTEKDVEMAILGLPLDVAGIQPTKNQLQKWQMALGTFAAGADFQLANANFVLTAATETHDALNKTIRYAGVASLAVSGGQLLVKEGCAAFARAVLAQMGATATGIVAGAVANNAASLCLSLLQKYGIQVDPDYLRIGADAIQLFSLVKAAKAERRAAGANCFAAGTLVDTASGETAINDLHVGQRVLTQVDNPFAKGEPLNADGDPNATAIDPATWREVTLDMPDPKAPGNDYRMQLLEPLSWIAQNAAKAGSWVDLNLPELQIDGQAHVDSIDACPTIQTGAGRVLLGTFEHVSHDVVDVKFTGDATALRVTSGHKLWSLDRGDWVQAGALKLGEHLATEHGAARVSSITAESVAIPVYNLNIEADHRYFVGSDAILAHNVNTVCAGSTSIGQKIKEFGSNPSKWEVVKTETVPSTRLGNAGGTSMQELLRNSDTGEELVRHTLFRANGSEIGSAHFRNYWTSN